MMTLLALTLLFAPAGLMPDAPAAVFIVAQEQGQDDDLKQSFKRFEAVLKGKEGEGEAINLMDVFVGRYRTAQERIVAIDDSLSVGEGDKKALLSEKKYLGKLQIALASEVHKAFTHKSRKKISEANLQMWRAGAFTLGQMGSSGGHYLWKVFNNKKFKKEPDFRGLCLEQIGYTHAYEEFADDLIDLLDHHEYLFIAKASDALAQFGAAPGSVRKEAVERLQQLLAQNWEDSVGNKTDEEAQTKYRKTGQAMRNALEALTATTQPDPLAWTKWWNKNKKNKEIWSDA